MSSEPIRQPANDLVAFDVKKQSPEQIANLFARWKQQRERLQAPETRRRPPHLKPVPPIVHGAAAEAEEAAPVADAESDGAVRYSASFQALLSAREPTLARRVWDPDAGLAKFGQPRAPRRRSRTKWFLAGAASVLALTAMAGGALWEQSAGRPGWTQAGGQPAADSARTASPAAVAVTPTYPMDIPMAEPFVAKATATRMADWPLRQAVDLALMETAPVSETAHLPLMPQLKPPVPVVQTASKAAAKPAAVQPEAGPSEASAARVALPLAPSVTTAKVSVPVAPAAETRNGDPAANTQRGNDKDNVTFGTNSRVASSSGRPAGASGSGGSADPGSGSTGGSGDPGAGGDPGGGAGGSDPGGGDPGGGNAGGGDAGGDNPGGGDPGGGNSGGGDSDGGGAGGDSGGAGGGDSGGGDSGGDDSGSGEGGESGGSGGSGGRGIGGAIGGALGGVGEALGGALGGGKGDANSGKDRDKDKGKDKSD